MLRHHTAWTSANDSWTVCMMPLGEDSEPGGDQGHDVRRYHFAVSTKFWHDQFDHYYTVDGQHWVPGEMFKTVINCIVDSSIDELQLNDWITNPFGHQGYGILCIYTYDINWFTGFLPTDFVSGVTNHSLKLNSHGVTTHRLCWEEHLHLWFDDLQNSESIHGWNNTRYKETQHQTLHFSSISILQTLLSSIETSMELNSFPKWWSTIKHFSFPPRTPHQLPGAPYSVTVMSLCPETCIYPYHLAPQGITRRMGTVTLMVQDLWPYFGRDFPRIWVWGLDLVNISEILTKKRMDWYKMPWKHTGRQFSLPLQLWYSSITNNNDRPALFSNFHTWAVSKT